MYKTLFIVGWVLSLLIAILYTYENSEKLDVIKNRLKKNFTPDVKIDEEPPYTIIANSFHVKLSKVISLSEKTAFIIHDENILNFDEKALKIFTQNGYLIKNLKSEKLNLPENFTLEKNGGVKTVFFHKGNKFALISSLKNKCFYSSIVSLMNGKELFETKCLPGGKEEIDYNGLGSSNIHYNNYIYLSVGAPEQISLEIAQLAQESDSMFGKILEINKNDLDKIINNEENKLSVKIFSKGHRNPQGFTKIKESFFSVEHGPRGGDELNKIIKDKNYGWPITSYGEKYLFDEQKKSYEKSHEDQKFEEPLFALVPSVGISALNKCPRVLENYYKKPCLLALSLYGNSLRPGKSIIIYLLNKKMDKVHSVEKIFLRDDLKLRHFVTNSKNELYEDKNGNIFVSADKNGIYKLNFANFRN